MLKVILGIFFLFFLFKIIRYWVAKEKCPACSSRKIDEQRRDIVAQKYKHEKKSGERDQRYKDNPLINTWRLSMKCSNCGHEWTKDCLQASTGEKSTSPLSEISKTRLRKAEVHANESHIQSNKEEQTSPSTANKLKALKRALEKGLISEEEYARKRKVVIDQI